MEAAASVAAVRGVSLPVPSSQPSRKEWHAVSEHSVRNAGNESAFVVVLVVPQSLNLRYFDSYGIIRDIMQNHLFQILALFAMETPVSLDAEDIRNEKVKVLRSMRSLQLEDVVIG
ncbi:hypothetical protein F0562_012773 [Nyssa sinensis]|uniref:Glucose-6-phosphate dehydrogenase C-terminal domain-containing protein n=1 Tax=Nyssa sinensis TaxID=561372 RepID=A0A5J4ZT10_9ASTE|nr:hypothetical protein F0562_012773 [Nyssa sinensis]